MKERLRGFMGKAGKKPGTWAWYFVFIIALGMMLMFLGGLTGGTGENGEQTEELLPLAEAGNTFERHGYERALEEKLENTLSAAAGVGKVYVMLTVSERDEIELAEDVTTEKPLVASDGGAAAGQGEKQERKHVIVTGGGQAQAVVTKRIEPKVEGVVIVAEGGGSAEVKTSLIHAAAALLNLPAHKIEVLQMDVKQ